MKIIELDGYTSTMHNCGINKAILTPVDDGKRLLVAGIDDDGMIAVFHEVGNSVEVEHTIGITNIGMFVGKLKLLDLSKTASVVETTTKNGKTFTKAIAMKCGRKRATHTFGNPDKIEAPISKHPSPITTEVQFTPEETDELKKAISAFSPKVITMKADGEKLHISFEDESGDIYTETICDSDKYIEFSWKKEKFVKLMNNVSNKETGSSFGITEAGLMFFFINNLTVMLAPVVA